MGLCHFLLRKRLLPFLERYTSTKTLVTRLSALRQKLCYCTVTCRQVSRPKSLISGLLTFAPRKTHQTVATSRFIEYEKEATIFMASKKSQKMRITLKAYDHQLIDFAAAKLIETVKNSLHGKPTRRWQPHASSLSCHSKD